MCRKLYFIFMIVFVLMGTVFAQEAFEKDVFETSKGDLTVTFIGHGTLMFECDKKVIHVDPRGFRKLLIITSMFHMPRTRAIFEWVYGLPSPGNHVYELHFEAVPDEGMDEELLKIKIKREKERLEHVLRLQEEIRTFQQFHQWLFTVHGAYAAAVEPVRIKGKILDTY